MVVRVEGAEQLRRLALDLKAAGDVELRRELFKGLSRALKPAKPAVQRAMREKLPSGGGLAARVAETTVLKRKIKTMGRSVGAGIYGDGKLDIGSLDRGRVRHPLFGNRKHWYDTEIEPGFFTHTLHELEPEVRAEFIAAMDRVERMLAAGR